VEQSVVNVSAGYRSPSGRKRPKFTPRHAGANNIKVRMRRNWDLMRKHGADPVWGSAVGIMHLDGILTDAEADAAIYYAEVCGRYDRYHPNKDGALPRSARAQSYDFGNRAADTEIERHNQNGSIKAYEKRAKKTQQLWDKIQAEIPGALRDRVDQLCLLDERPPYGCWLEVKSSLGRIAAKFLYGTSAQRKQGKAFPTEKRAQVIARRVSAAVVNIIDYFDQAKAVAKTFQLVASRGEFGIRVHGLDVASRSVQHAVMLSLRKEDMVEQIAAMFLKQCEAQGWVDHPKETT
jgi:hypothetical protein